MHRDGGLEIVALLAGHPQFVALDRGLNLELAVLQLAHQLLGQRRIDALAQQPRSGAPTGRPPFPGGLKSSAAASTLRRVMCAFNSSCICSQLHLVVGQQQSRSSSRREIEDSLPLNSKRVAISRASAATRIVDFGDFQPRDDVEARHSTPLAAWRASYSASDAIRRRSCAAPSGRQRRFRRPGRRARSALRPLPLTAGQSWSACGSPSPG